MAKGARGKSAKGAALLASVTSAARRGVIFPLSTTHYLETSQISDPRQRRDLASVMIPLSGCTTIRRRKDLVQHQLLISFHEVFGRPAFRPNPLEVLGYGANWAFRGEEASLQVVDARGEDAVPTAEQLDWTRRARLSSEALILAGPKDDELEDLRSYGYDPEALAASTASRLAWEANYATFLKSLSGVSRSELRVFLHARELTHEYLEVFNDIVSEYRLPFARLIGVDANHPRASRRRMLDVMDRVPIIRIAVDLKLEVYRNSQRTWSANMMHDIEALAEAVPYCDVVVGDKDAVNLILRSKNDARHSTTVLSDLRDLEGVLQPLEGPSADNPMMDRPTPGDLSCFDLPGTMAILDD